MQLLADQRPSHYHLRGGGDISDSARGATGPAEISVVLLRIINRYPIEKMQHVSSLGGPRVLLPTSDINRWIAELGDCAPDNALYRLACCVNDYCGVIAPWETPLLIFGDDPADIYFQPAEFDGLFFRWVAANSLDELTSFAIAQARTSFWDQCTSFHVDDQDMTLMDTCSFDGDVAPRIRLQLRPGAYAINSRYAESSKVRTIIHRLEYIG